MAKKSPLANYAGRLKELAAGDWVEGRSPVSSLGTSGTVNIDCSLGNYFTLSAPTGNVTLTVSNVPASPFGYTLMLAFTQHGTTPRTVTFQSGAIKKSGAAVSSGASKKDLIAMTTFDNGTTWYVDIGNDYS